jgi:RND family efflux transporter MFP subunit
MVRLNGDVSPESEVSVLPETSGRVTRIIKDLGDSVRLGDVIAWIDPSRAGVSYEANPVLSPVSGTITKLAITVGAQVTTSSEVAAVGSLDQLKLVIYVAEKYSSYLKRGLPAVVSFTAAPGEEFEASVTSVSPVVNNKNRTIETNLHLKKTDARIKDGMFAQVRLVIREESKAIVIPRASIKDYNGTDTVYVVDENGFARRVRIVLGLTNDTDAQVLEGLQAGDRVITAGAVSDGSLVRIAGSAV